MPSYKKHSSRGQFEPLEKPEPERESIHQKAIRKLPCNSMISAMAVSPRPRGVHWNLPRDRPAASHSTMEAGTKYATKSIAEKSARSCQH